MALMERQFPLLALSFLVHFILILIILFLGVGWVTNAFWFYNIFFLLALLWAMHSHERAEATMMVNVINVVAIIMDIIILWHNWPGSNLAYRTGHIHWKTSVVFFIINLIARIASFLAALRVHYARGGTNTGLLRSGVAAAAPSTYDDLVPPFCAGAALSPVGLYNIRTNFLSDPYYRSADKCGS